MVNNYFQSFHKRARVHNEKNKNILARVIFNDL